VLEVGLLSLALGIGYKLFFEVMGGLFIVTAPPPMPADSPCNYCCSYKKYSYSVRGWFIVLSIDNCYETISSWQKWGYGAAAPQKNIFRAPFKCWT